jgi:hypothetical protein
VINFLKLTRPSIKCVYVYKLILYNFHVSLNQKNETHTHTNTGMQHRKKGAPRFIRYKLKMFYKFIIEPHLVGYGLNINKKYLMLALHTRLYATVVVGRMAASRLAPRFMAKMSDSIYCARAPN